MASNPLIIKIQHDNIPQIKDRYPFLYLEKGRLEIDDSSVKWIDSSGFVVRLPIATISTLLLGPGTSITHEAIKVLSSANTAVCWVGEDSLLFYAVGHSPTADTRLMRKQMELSCSSKDCEEVARRMFSERFPDEDISECSISELRGKEGLRVRNLYETLADQYGVGWKGRRYKPGEFEMSDVTNKILTASNVALYSLVLSVVVATGHTPYAGFIHKGSPLPFVYDIADLYKHYLTIDFAFLMTKRLAGDYDRKIVFEAFRERVTDFGLLAKLPGDIKRMLGEKG